MSSPSTASVPPLKSLDDARRQYAEQFGSVLVANTYLKIALVLALGIGAGLVWLNVSTLQTVANFKPLVIRISDIGRAEAVAYDTLAYTPQAAEIRYFLQEFVTWHYGRRRATLQEDYPKSLHFLDQALADATIAAHRAQPVLETFLLSQDPEIEIEVHQVSIDDLREPPYEATIDFDQVSLSRQGQRETGRARFEAHVQFVVRPQVSNALVPVNPLGLTITYFRRDQAFTDAP